VSAGPGAFVPPTYPFDKLHPLAALGAKHPGGLVDLSVGTPVDPPPPAVVEALATSGAERGYPSGVGSERLLGACRAWMVRRFGVEVGEHAVAACIGTKELVAGIPHWLRLRSPAKSVVLYPEISYPTYAMGALLAGARPVPVPARSGGGLDLDAIDEADAAAALCLWTNSPSNPTGALDDLAAAAEWGRARGIPVLSDECYTEMTWEGRPRTILEHGSQGVLAVHSISKRSNAAGLRCGFYAGDEELVRYLSELRRHAGFMVPGPVQAAAAVALEDDDHVMVQRERYLRRLRRFVDILGSVGLSARLPAGGFYLWVAVDTVPERLAVALRRCPAGTPGTDADATPAWAVTAALAAAGGVLVSPGDFYGPAGSRFIRVALVAPDERLELVAQRLAALSLPARPYG
jgi:aspartate/methionine/tyrosine aminotransferase